MKAMLLAAGKSERLGGLNRGLPKVLMPVLGRPILEHNLFYLRRAGIRQVGINLHYRADDIIDFVKSRSWPGLRIIFSYEEKLFGTAGAVKKMEPFFKDAPFLVMYGDNLMDFDIKRLEKAHKKYRPLVTIGVYDPLKSAWSGIAAGLVRVNPEGRVLAFAERKSNREVGAGYRVNAGILIASPEILSYIPDGKSYDFAKDVFPALLKKRKRLQSAEGAAYVLASDTIQSLQRTRRLAAGLIR